MKKKRKQLPAGWTEKKIRRVLKFYERQSDEEAASEIEAAGKSGTWMSVPRALVPTVRSLIARHAKHSDRRRNHATNASRN